MPQFNYEQKLNDAYGMGTPMPFAMPGFGPPGAMQAMAGGFQNPMAGQGQQQAQQAPPLPGPVAALTGSQAPTYLDWAFAGSPASFALQGIDPKMWAGMNREDRGLSMAMTSGGAQRLSDFESMMPGLISQATQGAYGQALESMGGQQRLAQQRQQDALAAGGLSSSQLFSRIGGEQSLDWARPMAELGYQAQAGEAQGLMDLYGNVLNARNQMEQFYDQMAMQSYLASKQRKLARSGAKYGMIGDILGGAASVGSAFAMPG